MTRRTLEYYQGLPYARAWEAREEGDERYFVVRLVDIPQVVGGGRSKDDALRALRDAFDDYIAWRLDEGLPVPDPGWAFSRTSVRTKKVVLLPIAPPTPTVASSRLEPTVETRSRAESVVAEVAA